ncbi:MAG TPA: glycosyltransferase [Solirubrobacteraceae bacterium]|nr:glycosyltransferase [Solirubrobacteraceae bacterium]
MSATFTPRLTEERELLCQPLSRPDIEIVVPVYNEERVLAQSIHRLHRFLGRHLPFAWRIVIADNASSDLTPEIGQQLTDRLPDVAYLRLDQKGRGRALRAAWSRSQARVVAYMDVDLSTDLRALLPLVAPLLSGHSQLAIGSRLSRGARVTRGRKREFISRSYNRLLRLVLRARFSDAQCGFKAVRRDVVADLLLAIRDQAWFFDTELLVNAQRAGLRIHEVPVDWIEDPDSRVDIVSTALADLRGMARLVAAARPARFLAIGILSTLAYALLFALLAGVVGASAANALALTVTAIANTAANRRFTFGLWGRRGALRQFLAGGLVYVLTLGLTTGALDLLHRIDPMASRGWQLAVLILSSLAATVTRYFGYSAWAFRRRDNRSGFGAGGLGQPRPRRA